MLAFCHTEESPIQMCIRDSRYGPWYRILDQQNHTLSDEKSPACKTDYHTIGACHELLRLLRSQPDALKA